MLKGVRLVAPADAGHFEQLPQQGHGGKGLAGAAGAGHDDGLRVAGLSLHSHSFLDDFSQLRTAFRRFFRRRQGQRVAHVAVRVDRKDDWPDIGLWRENEKKIVTHALQSQEKIDLPKLKNFMQNSTLTNVSKNS